MFNVEYKCKIHGKFDILFNSSAEATATFPCIYDDNGVSHEPLDPAPHCRIPAPKDEVGNLPRRIATDQGWEGGIATPRGVFQSRKKYLEALTASGSVPHEKGMDLQAKRTRQYKEEESMKVIKDRVAQTYQELNAGRTPFKATISADDPLNYGFDK